MPEATALNSIRERIDGIDERIHELLNERARLAQQVGVSKRSEGLSTVDFYKPEREAQVLRNAIERNKGPLRNEEIVRLFREIMSACLAQQEPLKIAFREYGVADGRIEPANASSIANSGVSVSWIAIH